MNPIPNNNRGGAAIAFFLLLFALSGCSASNKQWCEDRAVSTWKDQGFDVVAYEGYEWGPFGFGTKYGGAQVWYRLRKVPDNGITYSGSLQRWGDEVQVYGPDAADALKGGR